MLRLAVVTLGIAAVTIAQTVHLVGPGGFAQIGAAIAAAAPGDVVEVATGTYVPFVLDKALTIRAAPGAQVAVLPVWLDPVRLRPPVGTVAVIAHIEFRNPWPLWALETRVERGTVVLEDCVCEAGAQIDHHALVVDNATAVLRHCLLAGYGVGASAPGFANHGLSGTNAMILASDCTMVGSNTHFDSYGQGGAGVFASASRVHLVRCAVFGGDQLHCFASPPGPGIFSTAGSTLWLADCSVEGGSACAFGANGLIHQGALPAQAARTTILGGLAGGVRATAVVGALAPAPLLGLAAASTPIVRGSTFTVQYRTEPNWPIVVVFADSLQPHLEPLVVQPVALPGAGAVTLAVQVADASGLAVYQTNVPNVPAMLHARLFVQAVSGLATPLQTSPPLGGLVW